MSSEWVCFSKPMQELLQMADRVSHAQGNVLILGASGTGKARVAQYIHEKSGLGTGGFVLVDCAAIPESLFESELFGSVRGAYSDATVDRPGLVTQAEGGTLYFHHIEAFPLTLQSKILRFVADREYRPVGGSTTHQVRTRILASSVMDMPNLIEKGLFRHDLYFRLAVFTLVVPPLNARLDDLNSLIEVFSKEYPNLGEISAALYAEILSYQWPGNVRELKNWVERSASSGSWLSPFGKKINSVNLKLKDAVNFFKREFIRHVLTLAEGNQTRAAQLLGISRTHLIKLLQVSTYKKENYDGKQINLNEGIYSFMSKNRKLLLVVISFITLGFLGLGIFALVSYQMNMDAIAIVDRASIRFEKWNQLDSSAAQFTELEGEIKNILQPFTNPRSESYAGSKALWILASIAEKKQNATEQKERLIQLISWYPNSPYNVQASYKLAEIYLNEENILESIKIFENLMQYRDIPALFKEEALYNLGILYESLDPAKSRSYFDELVQTYPLSDWTKLTRSRIIYQELLRSNF